MKMNCSCDNVLQNCLRYLETRLPFKSNISRYTFFFKIYLQCHYLSFSFKNFENIKQSITFEENNNIINIKIQVRLLPNFPS